MPGPLVGATIALGMEDGGVPATVEKVTADLSSAKRAGKDAEDAAKAAKEAAKESADAARELAHRVRHAVTELRHAVHLMERMAKAAGVDDGSPLGIGLEALSGGVQAFKFGNAIAGPWGGIAAFAGGAAFSGYKAYNESTEKGEQQTEKDADKLAEALARAVARQNSNDLERMMRSEADSKHAASILGGVRHDQ